MIIQCPTCQLRYDVAHRAPGTRARCRCGASFTVPAQDAQSSSGVRCGGCGAQNASQARACAWCGAAMATVSCAACLSLNPASYQHCSQCGGSLHAPARRLEEAPDEQPLPCPRCEQPLEARLLADTLVDQCAACGGVWLDHEVLGRLLTDRARQAPLRERLLQLPKATPRSAEPGKVTYLRCPECAVFMNRRNPAYRSGIIVDVCAGHGVWFDDRELAILMRLASSGAELNVAPKPKLDASLASGGGGHAAARLPGSGRSRTRTLGEWLVEDGGPDLRDLLSLVGRLF